MLLNVNIEFTYVQYFSTELCYVDNVGIALSYYSVSILSYFTYSLWTFPSHKKNFRKIAIYTSYLYAQSFSQVR
jgi:hypothetical protein